MKWIVANWELVTQIITGIISVSSLITKITPNTTDNKVVLGVQKVVEVMALNTSPAKLTK